MPPKKNTVTSDDTLFLSALLYALEEVQYPQDLSAVETLTGLSRTDALFAWYRIRHNFSFSVPQGAPNANTAQPSAVAGASGSPSAVNLTSTHTGAPTAPHPVGVTAPSATGPGGAATAPHPVGVTASSTTGQYGTATSAQPSGVADATGSPSAADFSSAYTGAASSDITQSIDTPTQVTGQTAVTAHSSGPSASVVSSGDGSTESTTESPDDVSSIAGDGPTDSSPIEAQSNNVSRPPLTPTSVKRGHDHSPKSNRDNKHVKFSDDN
ncbi:hypothetical protein KCV07_g3769, partial [Aureobasidium melanogenum]